MLGVSVLALPAAVWAIGGGGLSPGIFAASEAVETEPAPLESQAAASSAAEGPEAMGSSWAELRALDPPLDGRSVTVARVGELVLRLPSPSPLVVGFHEASLEGALEMTPVGILIANENATRFTPPPDDPSGSPYLVMSSRGRPLSPTSALDVVMVDDDPVLSPVTGTVTDVRSYQLYGTHLDERVEVAPDDAPELRVVVVHLDEVEVEVGERVVGGVSELARSARRFPFSSQIDRETEPERWPHVHIEVKHEDTPRPE